jgi:hypothetical protein
MTTRQKRITERQHLNVQVPGPNLCYSGRYTSSGYRIPEMGLSGTYCTDDWGRSWVKVVSNETYIDGYTLECAITELRQQAEGMDDPRIDLDTSDYPRLTVTGTRPALVDEVVEVLRYLDWAKAEQENRKVTARERLIEQARALGITADDLT